MIDLDSILNRGTSFELLTSGTFGVVYKVHHKKSDYIMKLSLLLHIPNQSIESRLKVPEVTLPNIIGSDLAGLLTTTNDLFESEVRMQKEAQRVKALNGLMFSLCPEVHDSDVVDFHDERFKSLYQRLDGFHTGLEVDDFVGGIGRGFDRFKVGVIIMEYVESTTLEDRVDKASFRRKAIAVILEYAYLTGINHADFHMNNILVTPNDDVYLIDFGMSTRLSVNVHQKLIQYCDEGKMVDAVRLLYGGKRANGVTISNRNNHHYGWVTPNFNYNERRQTWVKRPFNMVEKNAQELNTYLKRIFRVQHVSNTASTINEMIRSLPLPPSKKNATSRAAINNIILSLPLPPSKKNAAINNMIRSLPLPPSTKKNKR